MTMTATRTLPPTIRCPRCQTTKTRAEFGNNRSRANGKNSECKTCASSRAKAYRSTDAGRAAVAATQKRSVAKARRAYGLDVD